MAGRRVLENVNSETAECRSSKDAFWGGGFGGGMKGRETRYLSLQTGGGQ